ncbi:thioredoxin domain-containing protein, partial [Synechococcus sp. H55.9]
MAHKQQFKSFDDMIQGSKTPILVDFYATWCGPCQVMAQVLEQVKP